MADGTPKGRIVQELEGDADAIETGATALREEAVLLHDAGALIAAFGDGGVVGLAGDAIDRIASDCGDSGVVLVDAAARYDAAADVIGEYGTVLREHQRIVREGIAMLDQNRIDSDAAALAWQEAQAAVTAVPPDDPSRERLQAECDAASGRYDGLFEAYLELLRHFDVVYDAFERDYHAATSALQDAVDMAGGDTGAEKVSAFLGDVKGAIGPITDVLDTVSAGLLVSPLAPLAAPVQALSKGLGTVSFAANVGETAIDLATRNFVAGNAWDIGEGVVRLIPFGSLAGKAIYREMTDVLGARYASDDVPDWLAKPVSAVVDPAAKWVLGKLGKKFNPDPVDDWRRALGW